MSKINLGEAVAYISPLEQSQDKVLLKRCLINFKNSKHKKQNFKEWSYSSGVSGSEAAA